MAVLGERRDGHVRHVVDVDEPLRRATVGQGDLAREHRLEDSPVPPRTRADSLFVRSVIASSSVEVVRESRRR
jgi:hypothetical protein